MAPTDAQVRSFDRNYRWLLLRALREFRGIGDTNLNNNGELTKVYGTCLPLVLQSAQDQGFDLATLDLLQATTAVRNAVAALAAAARAAEAESRAAAVRAAESQAEAEAAARAVAGGTQAQMAEARAGEIVAAVPKEE